MAPHEAPEARPDTPPRTRFGRSVPGVVITAIAGLTTLTLGIFLIIGYTLESNRRHAELEAEANRAAHELATSLALPAWNFDQPQAEKILDSVMQDPRILQVWVTIGTRRPETYARYRNVKWEPVASDHPPASTGEDLSDAILLERPISASGTEVGTVHLCVTRRFLHSELHRLLLVQLAGLALLGVLLAGGLFTLLRWIVLRPLVEIGRFPTR